MQTEDRTGIIAYLNDVSKHVVSSTLQDPEWEHTAVMRSTENIGALKSEPGGDIVTTGSISLVRELIAGEFVDEYRLFTYPVVLGRGQRLFADATEIPRLRLIENKRFRSGTRSCATGHPDGHLAIQGTTSASPASRSPIGYRWVKSLPGRRLLGLMIAAHRVRWRDRRWTA